MPYKPIIIIIVMLRWPNAVERCDGATRTKLNNMYARYYVLDVMKQCATTFIIHSWVGDDGNLSVKISCCPV